MERFEKLLKTAQASPMGEALTLLKCDDIKYEKAIDAPIGIYCIRQWGRHRLTEFLSPKRVKAIYKDGTDYYVVALVDPNEAAPFLAPELPPTAQLVDTPIVVRRARCPQCGSFDVIIDADEMGCNKCGFSDFWHVEDVALYEPPKSPFDLNAVFKSQPRPPEAYLRDLEEEEKKRQLDTWARQKLQELGYNIQGSMNKLPGYEVLPAVEVEENGRRLKVGIVLEHWCEYDGPCETRVRFFGAVAQEQFRYIIYVLDNVRPEHVRSLNNKGLVRAIHLEELVAMMDTETALRAVEALRAQRSYGDAMAMIAKRFGFKVRITTEEVEKLVKETEDIWRWLLEAIQEHPDAFEVEPAAVELLKKRLEEYEEQKRKEREEWEREKAKKRELFEATLKKVEELNRRFKGALDVEVDSDIFYIYVKINRYLKKNDFDALIAELRRLGFEFRPKKKHWYYSPRV